jgi:GR25 family glycosyltransferase involved in LPS biosynthesis
MLKSLIACIALLAMATLWADIDDHLKKVDHGEKEESPSTLQGIDCIYVINLDQRPEKFKQTAEQLAAYGIVPLRFSAVNGWELSLEAINDVGLKFSPEMEGGFMATSYHLGGHYEPSHELIENYGQTYFCHCMARGTIGIALSHISILKDAFDRGYETIWIMEDDIDVIQDPHILSYFIDKLDALVGRNQWDILFTDKDMRRADGDYNPCYWAARRPDITMRAKSNDYGARSQVGKSEFWKIGARYGAHSMIVRRRGMKKLLQHFMAHKIYLPYDLEFILPLGIKLFAVLDDVVSNLPKAISDNGGPNYLNKMKREDAR